jgi:hypothetical protein
MYPILHGQALLAFGVIGLLELEGHDRHSLILKKYKITNKCFNNNKEYIIV